MNRHTDYADPEAKQIPVLTIAILVALGAAVTFSVLYFFLDFGEEQTTPLIESELTEQIPASPELNQSIIEEPVASSPPPGSETAEQVSEPTPSPQPPAITEVVEDPLPNIHSSDDAVSDGLKTLSSDGQLLKFIVPESLIQRFVRVVIALHEGEVVRDYRPVTSPVAGLNVIAIEETLDPDVGQRYRLSSANYSRYDPWVNAFSSIDKKAAIKLYQRYYPLLQEAYKQHGAKIKEFDTVLMQVIDECLSVEATTEQPILIRQKVFYQYFDKNLENSSDMVKLLTRIGPSNTKNLQTALRELRAEITSSDKSK